MSSPCESRCCLRFSQSSVNARAMLSCWSDPDIVANQAHQSVPTIGVGFDECQSGRPYQNMQNSHRLGSCYCCCCMSSSRMNSCTIKFFAMTGFLELTRKPHLCTSIPRPVLFKYMVVNIWTFAFSCHISPKQIPMGANSLVFSKMKLQ